MTALGAGQMRSEIPSHVILFLHFVVISQVPFPPLPSLPPAPSVPASATVDDVQKLWGACPLRVVFAVLLSLTFVQTEAVVMMCAAAVVALALRRRAVFCVFKLFVFQCVYVCECLRFL